MEIRDFVIQELRGEIIGPAVNPVYQDEETGEEILLQFPHGSPQAKYGAGLLYPMPQGGQGCNAEDEATDSINAKHDYIAKVEAEKQTISANDSRVRNTDVSSIEEESIALANQYKPSAMGFSSRFSKSERAEIQLKICSAYYEKKSDSLINVRYINKEGEVTNMMQRDGENLIPRTPDYWVRRPLQIEELKIDLNKIFENGKKHEQTVYAHNNTDWLKLEIYDRSTNDDEFRTCTFSLINVFPLRRNDVHDGLDGILFQNKIILSTDSQNLIQPYKEKNSLNDTDDEREMSLLYRKKRVFGIGHGTSVGWSSHSQSSKVNSIFTTYLPSYDIPQIASPENKVYLSMLEHSDLGNWDKAMDSLSDMLSQYKDWIQSLEFKITKPELREYDTAAKRNIFKCKQALKRIAKGVEILQNADEDSSIVKCYKWMNRAMIWQQQRSRASQRLWIREVVNGRENYETLNKLSEGKTHFESLEKFHEGQYNGKWRPFQLAFILMNIEGIINPSSDERKIVDLIWFPTGGGKTEAYLGLTALTILYRRCLGAEDFENESQYGGTIALMRYTLRLLTAQQFERASSLICSLEIIRRDIAKNFELGNEPISIGLWVGGSTSPNKNSDALRSMRNLRTESNAEYPFIVLKCPCCAAQIGKIKSRRIVKSIIIQDSSVKFSCENQLCEFHNHILPLYVVDESIYNISPTLVIGTVDKFAMLTWKAEAGNLFGYRTESHRVKPPELIIQDELHLISGPLGSMVGLYEGMIDALCKVNIKYPPKIVAATATISRAFEQVKALYAKEKSQLNIFPAQGLEFGNTWFSEEIEVNENSPGRKYVGVMTTGYPSAQTTVVRCYSQILQSMKASTIGDSKKNYYWTLLAYFNSIRELGIATSLVFGDIRERLRQIQFRDLIQKDKRRILYDDKIQELTSRIKSEQIPSNLKLLEQEYSSSKNKALDICLATNMVATGVDISRLGLMFIHGQPKTTAEYIQASSRVGRKVPDGPGLVFTLFNVAKPRDKSIYEQFQGYHCRIYSNVEASSVTPYSINCRAKALHAVFIGLIRHLSNGSLRALASPTVDEFSTLSKSVKQIILERVKIVDETEYEETEFLLDSIIDRWQNAGVESYGDARNFQILNNEQFYPLMYAKGAEVRPEAAIRGLATPTSMRGVDTESNIINYNTPNHE